MLPFPVTERQRFLFFYDIMFQLKVKIKSLQVPEVEI